MIYKLYTSVDGKPGEFIDEWHGNDMGLISLCYENWPEKQEYDAAVEAWQKSDGRRWEDYPRWAGGRPPFEIQRPDGSWFEWQIERADDEDADENGEAVVLDESVSCQRCQSHRVADVGGKCRDLGHFVMGSIDHDGYVPYGVGIGGGDYIELRYCLDCGQIQGTFPLPLSPIEQGKDE